MEKNNQRNSFGFKHCGDCYRKGGKLTQYVDCQEKYRAILKTWVKEHNIPYKIVKIGCGMIRLFVDIHKAKNASNCPIYNGE